VDDARLTYDVVVAGGGAAGLSAAVAAARHGARTALIERYGFLGGMATAGMVGTVCGLYRTATTVVAEPLNGGFADLFARRLAAMPGCAGPTRRGRTFVLPYTPFAFACVADDLTRAVSGLDVYLHTYLTAVESAPGRIEAVRVATAERHLELAARVAVDTTGDAVVTRLAGAATEAVPASDRQLPSLIFVLQRVDTDALSDAARLRVLRDVVVAERAGVLPKGTSNLSLAPSAHAGEVVCKLALTGISEEPSASPELLTLAEREGRGRVLALATFLRTLPAFADSFVSHTAPQVGVRESRRVVGRYQLTRADVLSGRKFEDAVARASWPIELWEEGHLGATYEYLPDGETYDIPLSTLQARDVANLFVAGRCMSASHEALGSARVIGTCLATGEAVGAAAARLADSTR
jgi:hypothetical protein